MLIAPIKIQGKKTKLIPYIRELISELSGSSYRWVEPFMGSGIVGFNLASDNALFSDNHAAVIEFYDALYRNEIDSGSIRSYLEREGKLLSERGESYYYEVRERYNRTHDVLDFLFLNRACFNGLIRYNQSGKFNVPFCRNAKRYSKQYITKIVNQVRSIESIMRNKSWQFVVQDFRDIISSCSSTDILYCDPPYSGRLATYYTTWTDNDERELHELLSVTEAKFILSTWLSTEYRENEAIKQFAANYRVIEIAHEYQVGPKLENRYGVVEALVTNI